MKDTIECPKCKALHPKETAQCTQCWFVFPKLAEKISGFLIGQIGVSASMNSGK